MNKKQIFILVLSFITHMALGQSKSPSKDEFINTLLKKMTIEEKVGQMTQINLNVILKDGFASKSTIVSPELLNIAINKYGVGSILNVCPDALTIDQWQALIKEIQDAALKNKKINSCHLWYRRYPWCYLHTKFYLISSQYAEAASRNIDLVKAAAKITAKEVRASSIRWNFDPF